MHRSFADYEAALNRFQWTDPGCPDAIDAAIYELCAAERRVGIELRELREKILAVSFGKSRQK